MKINENPDRRYVKVIREELKANGGYCPCKISKTDDTKCMCKEFRDMIKRGEPGICHCGLYLLTNN